MFARKGLFSSIGRAGAVATVAAVALTAVEPSMAFAGSARCGQGRRRRRPGPATRPTSARAAGTIVAAVVPRRLRPSPGIVGTGIAIAASQNRRDRYYDHGPVYYGGGPAYYGGGPYYGRPHYYGGTDTTAPGERTPLSRPPARQLVIATAVNDRSTGRPCAAGGFFWRLRTSEPAVNTLAIGFPLAFGQ